MIIGSIRYITTFDGMNGITTFRADFLDAKDEQQFFSAPLRHATFTLQQTPQEAIDEVVTKAIHAVGERAPAAPPDYDPAEWGFEPSAQDAAMIRASHERIASALQPQH